MSRENHLSLADAQHYSESMFCGHFGWSRDPKKCGLCALRVALFHLEEAQEALREVDEMELYVLEGRWPKPVPAEFPKLSALQDKERVETQPTTEGVGS